MVDINNSITGFDAARLADLVASLGEPAYRAGQLRQWVYRRLARSFDEMSDLPLDFRRRLSAQISLHSLALAHEVSSEDGTVKALFRLGDGHTVEAALMSYHPEGSRSRRTVCVSTQVGCPIGCPFCATGQQGFERNLTTTEIIDQVLYFARYLRDEKDERASKTGRLTNIVFMGMGEPLANYDNLWGAIETLNSPDGFGLGARNMTVSTSGLVPQIERLSREKLQIGLAVSLHAGGNALRDRLVPINKKYPLERLIPACRDYHRATGRRVSFEYVLFEGVNASTAQARALAGLLHGLNCHVNLIPANATGNPDFRPPSRQAVHAFAGELKRAGINTTLRQSKGQGIDAGCGQLRSRLSNA